ncbi:MAG: choice-of-anchor D domain-containing protein, partial [Bacteroidota bacterium]
CGTSILIQFNGATELIGTGAVLRIGKAGFNPVNREQTPCDISRCTDVILSNAGNAPLNIESIDWLHNDAGYTFTPAVTTPFTIAANETRTLPVCLNSRQSRGFLRDTLVVKSNSRTSIAFGLTIDVSGSMATEMHCGSLTPTRLEQAQAQAKNFIAQTLLNLPGVGVQDQLVISSYSTLPNSYDPDITFIFPLAYITDASRLVAQSEIDKLVPKNHTPTWLALLQMIDSLSASPLKNRVIVLLTDGDADDLLTIPVDSISRTAQAKGIRIFTIGLNLTASAISYLQGLAAGTNGVAFPAIDCNSLQTAFETITDLVSRGNVMREPFSIRITSPVLVATKSTDFDSVYIGGKSCQDITITNVGEGDAIVDTMMINDLLGGTATGEFSMQPLVKFPVLVPESGQLKLTLCFTPAKIRVRGGSATLTYNSCGTDTLHTTFGGVGVASANLRISDRRVGPPGSIITMPVYADSAIGAYGVNTITYGLRWDKSVLDLKAIRPGSAAAGTTLKMTAPVSYANFYATVGLVSQGSNLTGGGELAQLDFEVLRGDSLLSDVELTNGLFEDNNPKTKLNNAGAVALDSTCFLSSKPIKFASVAKVAVGDVTPTPSTGHEATIPVSTDIATSITLEVYAADGSRAMAPAMHQIPSGGATLGVNVARLAPGSYYAMLRTESGEIMVRKFVVTR